MGLGELIDLSTWVCVQTSVSKFPTGSLVHTIRAPIIQGVVTDVLMGDLNDEEFLHVLTPAGTKEVLDSKYVRAGPLSAELRRMQTAMNAKAVRPDRPKRGSVRPDRFSPSSFKRSSKFKMFTLMCVESHGDYVYSIDQPAAGSFRVAIGSMHEFCARAAARAFFVDLVKNKRDEGDEGEVEEALNANAPDVINLVTDDEEEEELGQGEEVEIPDLDELMVVEGEGVFPEGVLVGVEMEGDMEVTTTHVPHPLECSAPNLVPVPVLPEGVPNALEAYEFESGSDSDSDTEEEEEEEGGGLLLLEDAKPETAGGMLMLMDKVEQKKKRRAARKARKARSTWNCA